MFGQKPITYGLLVQYKTFTTNILSSLLAGPGSPRIGAPYNIAYKGKHRQKGIPFQVVGILKVGIALVLDYEREGKSVIPLFVL